jgi:hypothetical protein
MPWLPRSIRLVSRLIEGLGSWGCQVGHAGSSVTVSRFTGDIDEARERRTSRCQFKRVQRRRWGSWTRPDGAPRLRQYSVAHLGKGLPSPNRKRLLQRNPSSGMRLVLAQLLNSENHRPSRMVHQSFFGAFWPEEIPVRNRKNLLKLPVR